MVISLNFKFPVFSVLYYSIRAVTVSFINKKMVLPPELPRVSTETFPQLDFCFSFAKTSAENRLSGSIWYFAERTARYSPGDTLLRISFQSLTNIAGMPTLETSMGAS